MTDTVPARMLPTLDDDNRGFWTSGSTGRLHLPFCDNCNQWVFPPKRTCPTCSGATEYRPVSGKGHVYTHTVNYHPFNPAIPVPYCVAIVDLVEQEGLRFTTNVVNVDPEKVEIGMPVQVLFEQQGEVYVPIFEPDPGGQTL